MVIEDNGFFDDLGGGILINKKEEKLKKEILENSKHLTQNTLDDKIKRRIKNIKPTVEEIPEKHRSKI
jgi:hypothetical protein